MDKAHTGGGGFAGVYRRGLLKRLAGLGGACGLAAGAGCLESDRPSGPRTPPRSVQPPADDGGGLVVTDFGEVEGEAGNVLVTVTIENRSGEERSALVVADVSAGENEVTVDREVTVPGSEEIQVTLETGLAYEEFARNGSISVEIQ